MNTSALAELAGIKQGARATWAAGDYMALAKRQLWPVGEWIVSRAGVAPGEDVLDVACGTGNAALRAAQAGGRVTGLDLTPELLDAGRREAAELGVYVDWVRGDAEELPFEDESFDVVLSTFGCMFAPRHAVAAGEIARVVRPGGRIAITTWPVDGGIADFFRTVGKYMPPPPAVAEPPLLWGSEEHVRALFDDSGLELEFERGIVVMNKFESADAEIEFSLEKFGPMIMARHMTEASGSWPELRADLERLYDEQGEEFEYLVTLGHKP